MLAAITMPAPESRSQPVPSISIAVLVSAVRTCDAVHEGWDDLISAARAAAWGAAAVILSPPARRRPAVLLWLFAAAQVATTVTLTVEPSVRFLHPVAWLGVVTAGVMAAAVGKGRKRNTVSGS